MTDLRPGGQPAWPHLCTGNTTRSAQRPATGTRRRLVPVSFILLLQCPFTQVNKLLFSALSPLLLLVTTLLVKPLVDRLAPRRNSAAQPV
jgi:hypothetical protein